MIAGRISGFLLYGIPRLSINPVIVLQPLHQWTDIQTRVHTFSVVLRKTKERSELRDRSQYGRGMDGQQDPVPINLCGFVLIHAIF